LNIIVKRQQHLTLIRMSQYTYFSKYEK